MPPLAQPGVLRLAQRLRDLRELGGGRTDAGGPSERLQPRRTRILGHRVVMGEPKFAEGSPAQCLTAYARFFATRRSVEADPPGLLALDE